MRMWMVDTRIQCYSHGLGEHRELHMCVGFVLNPKHPGKPGSILKPYLEAAIIEPTAFYSRHEELVAEFRRRRWPSGFNHTTPMPPVESIIPAERDKPLWNVKVHRVWSLLELLRRCPRCRTQYDKVHGDAAATSLLGQWNITPVDHKSQGLMINWRHDTPADATELTFSDHLVREAEALAKQRSQQKPPVTEWLQKVDVSKPPEDSH
jgi:hypothetical protein